jgi:mono/diheme cytochrome c family protein
MRRISNLVSIVIVILNFAAQAAEPPATLIVSDGKAEHAYTSLALLANPNAQQVTLASDPVYRRAMTYRAVPVAVLLRDASPGPDAYVQIRAVDGFSVSVPARLLTESAMGDPEALLAVEPPDSPWPRLPGQTAGAGPFYVIWRNAKAGALSSEFWAYRVASLTVVASPLERWPGLAVEASVPASDPIRRGQDRFVAVCMGCHRFNGEGDSVLGPDLGRPMNPVDYFRPSALRQYLRDPASLRTWPERKMPAFDKDALSDADIDAVIAWLSYKAKT